MYGHIPSRFARSDTWFVRGLLYVRIRGRYVLTCCGLAVLAYIASSRGPPMHACRSRGRVNAFYCIYIISCCCLQGISSVRRAGRRQKNTRDAAGCIELYCCSINIENVGRRYTRGRSGGHTTVHCNSSTREHQHHSRRENVGVYRAVYSHPSLLAYTRTFNLDLVRRNLG